MLHTPKMTRIFLTHNRSALRQYYGDRAFKMLSELGELRFHDSDEDATENDIIEQARDCEILVSYRIPPISAAVMDAIPNLAAVCRVAVDIRNIDVDHASELGILVTRASPGFGASVAEWIIGNMINLARHIPQAYNVYRGGEVPTAIMGSELRSATVGIIGFGTIGRYVTKLAAAFGMNIVVHDPYAEVPADSGARKVSLETLLADSDFVVCLAPANAETANLFNLSRFRQMRPSAYFINASRAELVNEPDLRRALDEGLIAACALDVGSAKDQMPPVELAMHPKVYATPHIGGLTPRAVEHQALDTVRQVQALFAGKQPEGAVNAAHARRAIERFGISIS